MRSLGVAHSITVVAHPFLLLLGVGWGAVGQFCGPFLSESVRHAPRASRTYEDVSRTVTRGDGWQPPMREWGQHGMDGGMELSAGNMLLGALTG